MLILAVTVCVATATSSAYAHHSHPIFYDQCTRITIEGRVEHVEFKEPHSQIFLRTDEGTAYTVDWGVSDEALELTGTASVSGVVITLTNKVASVSGEVRGRDGQPVRSYRVIVFPRDAIDPAGASRWIKTSRAGTDGRYEIRRMRPGRYLAAAVGYIEPGQERSPEFQQRLRLGARELTVGEGQNLTLDLVLTPDL
jgi:hypothetical protein